MRWAWPAAAGLCALVAACTPGFGQIDFTFDALPAEGDVRFERISLRQGAAVAVKAVPKDESGDVMDEITALELTSSDPAVLRTAPAAGDSGADAGWHFVIWGVHAGQCSVAVLLDGEHVADIPSLVEPPSTE